jgi:hypothetical protein
MTRRIHVVLYLALAFSYQIAAGQNNLVQKANGSLDVSPGIQNRVMVSLDSFLHRMEQQRIDSTDVTGVNAALSLSVFSGMKDQIWGADTNTPQIIQPALLKLYPLEDSVYFCSLAFLTPYHPKEILNILITFNSGRTAFSIPLDYFTRTWKRKTVGLTTYHYPDHINLQRAAQFDTKNRRMAMKLGLTPEKLDFYLCDNYQDILGLLGYSYDSALAGNIEDGYGVDNGTIFSIRHNEDFSHDLFHYYSAKFRRNRRNSAADEGVAYSWGNPMILPSNTKVRSLLSSLICDEIERRTGTKGVKQLIDCGPGDENYFRVADKLIGVNTKNFNHEMQKLLNQFNNYATPSGI